MMPESSLLTQFADNVIGEYQYTDRSGVRDLKKFDQVRLDDVDFTTLEEPDQVVQGDRVKLEFDCGGGTAGEVYEYIGADPLAGPGVNLDGQTFTDGTKWQKLDATSGGTYRFIADDETGVDLADEDYTDITRWLETISVDPREMIPGISFNISDSDSAAFGGLVVRNDVRSDVLAAINKADVTADGDIDLQALETAGIFAIDQSSVTSSGESTFGGGSSTAVGGVIATNLVLSAANAKITNSNVITHSDGSVLIDAQNTSTVKATIDSEIASNGTSIGVILAFNTIGIKPQNFLFSTVDALFGTNIANEQPAETQAFIKDSVVESAGAISATTTSAADIEAAVLNAANSITATIGDGDDDTGTITVGAVVALNKVSTKVHSYIDNTNASSSIVRSLTGQLDKFYKI